MEYIKKWTLAYKIGYINHTDLISVGACLWVGSGHHKKPHLAHADQALNVMWLYGCVCKYDYNNDIFDNGPSLVL